MFIRLKLLCSSMLYRLQYSKYKQCNWCSSYPTLFLRYCYRNGVQKNQYPYIHSMIYSCWNWSELYCLSFRWVYIFARCHTLQTSSNTRTGSAIYQPGQKYISQRLGHGKMIGWDAASFLLATYTTTAILQASFYMDVRNSNVLRNSPSNNTLYSYSLQQSSSLN